MSLTARCDKMGCRLILRGPVGVVLRRLAGWIVRPPEGAVIAECASNKSSTMQHICNNCICRLIDI